jgi:hypothetical protein
VCIFFSFFDTVRFVSTQLVSPFLLPGVASPLIDVSTPPHRVTLFFYGVKMSLLSPLYLSATLYPIVSPLELKPNIKSAQLSPATLPDRLTSTIYCYKKVISTLVTLSTTQSHIYFASSLPSKSTTSSELHPPPSFPFTAVPRPSSLRTTTPTVMN